MSEQYNLNFMHPQYGTTLNVDIDAGFSVQEILEQLVLSGFVGKANAQYDLELMGKALEKQTVFAAIPELYDGAVLRVVERLHAKPQKAAIPTSHPIQLHLQHPDHALPFSAAYDTQTLMEEVILRAIQQGFLVGSVADFQVYKGNKALAFGESLHELGLQEGDHLQLRHHLATEEEGATPPSVTLQTLQTQVQELQQQLGAQLQQLQRQLPREQTLPDVGELPYESLEKIVRRLRKQSKEPILDSLTLAGTPAWVYVGIVLLILAAVIGIAALIAQNIGAF